MVMQERLVRPRLPSIMYISCIPSAGPTFNPITAMLTLRKHRSLSTWGPRRWFGYKQVRAIPVKPSGSGKRMGLCAYHYVHTHLATSREAQFQCGCTEAPWLSTADAVALTKRRGHQRYRAPGFLLLVLCTGQFRRWMKQAVSNAWPIRRSWAFYSRQRF